MGNYLSKCCISQLLRDASAKLQSTSDSPRLDAELLMQQVLGLERHELICRESETLNRESIKIFEELVDRRMKQEPVAYIRGMKEFWGMNFRVGPGVLIPRPATELLVELTLSSAELYSGALSILDLGTGSGAISVSVAVELEKEARDFSIIASDASKAALEYARYNIEAYGLSSRIKLKESNWLDEFDAGKNCFDIIVSNPPYIAEDDQNISPALRFEPPEALFAGLEGLDAIRVLIRTVPEFLKPHGVFLCEFGAMQRQDIENFILRDSALSQKLSWSFHRDLSGLDRVLECSLF